MRLAVGDFNGDRNLDVAAINYQTNDTSVLLGNGDGTLGPAVNYPVGAQPLSVAVGDFNLDKAPDLTVANENSFSTSVLPNTGGTRMTLTGSPNPSRLNQPVTFTATVKTSVPGSGKPTGTVAFEAGATILGTSPVVGGQAMLTTAMLKLGPNEVRAIYSGDTNFNPNSAPPFVQLVRP